MFNWNEEDVTLFLKMKDAVHRGYYLHGKEVTNLYNRVLNKKLAPTNCGSCIRQRFSELNKYYGIYLSQQEACEKETKEVEVKIVEPEKPKKEVKKVTKKKITKTTTRKKK